MITKNICNLSMYKFCWKHVSIERRRSDRGVAKKRWMRKLIIKLISQFKLSRLIVFFAKFSINYKVEFNFLDITIIEHTSFEIDRLNKFSTLL